MQYSVFLPKVGHEIILKREREIKYVIRQTDKTQITLLKTAYSQSAQLCSFFEPIFPQNEHICASFRKKSVFIEKVVKI